MTKVARLPLKQTVGPIPNDPRLEFLFDVCDGLPRARQKRLILRARLPEVWFLGDTDAEILIDALGPKEA